MNTVERIKYMENLLETAETVIYRKNISADSADLAAVQPIIKELTDYYTNGLWLMDYDADEKGLLPQDLKRGVLSQDTLHNLLSENSKLTDSRKKKLLYIDSCIRGKDSRTRRIAEPVVAKLRERYEVETIILNCLDLPVIQKAELDRRFDGIVSAQALEWAKKIRDADRIVIAAPFWDMSFPAALKTFFELCSLQDITFKNGKNGCIGNCRCENLLYITTRGMNIKTGDDLEQATGYLKALCWLWGIKGFNVIARENLDYISSDMVEQQLDSAIREGLELAETF